MRNPRRAQHEREQETGEVKAGDSEQQNAAMPLADVANLPRPNLETGGRLTAGSTTEELRAQVAPVEASDPTHQRLEADLEWKCEHVESVVADQLELPLLPPTPHVRSERNDLVPDPQESPLPPPIYALTPDIFIMEPEEDFYPEDSRSEARYGDVDHAFSVDEMDLPIEQMVLPTEEMNTSTDGASDSRQRDSWIEARGRGREQGRHGRTSSVRLSSKESRKRRPLSTHCKAHY